MLVTLLGIVMLVKPLLRNALSPMLVTVPGMVMLVKSAHPLNKPLLMLVKPAFAGKVTLVNLLL